MAEDDQQRRTYEVGYKKPPKEHQFKKGHKPKPRRRRAIDDEESLPSDILWDILQEKRAIAINGKRRRMSNVDIIVQRLAEHAEKGSSGCNELLYQLAMMDEPDEDAPWEVIIGSPPDLLEYS